MTETFDAMIAAAASLDKLRAENERLVQRVRDLEERLNAALRLRQASCACSPVYLELDPGIHAQYCPLAGQELDVGRARWACERCGSVGTVQRCLGCGSDGVEVARSVTP